MAAVTEIGLISHSYQMRGWKEALGTSGTARAISELLELNQLNPDKGTGISRAGMEKLADLLIKAGSAQRLDIQGVRPDRQPVLPGGLAILMAVFDELGVEHMQYVDGALRHGVLYDLLGRYQHQDMRDVTARHFMKRYQVDEEQSRRVRQTALALFESLTKGGTVGTERQFLAWAADLHEIGISVAHNGYHKHGAYILTYADMPGFSKKDQSLLATLVLGHRGKLERLAAMPVSDPGWQWVFCLRIAALLHRHRDDRVLPSLAARALSDGFQLELPQGWLDANPWTHMALKEEVPIWEQVGIRFCEKARREPEKCP